MTKMSDRIAQRIATIAAQKPMATAKPLLKPHSGRRDPRRQVYRLGRLTLAGGVKLDCIIVDVSRNGARIELGDASGLPDFVSLKVIMTGEVRRARVVWKRENAAGLSFLMERKSGFGSAVMQD